MLDRASSIPLVHGDENRKGYGETPLDVFQKQTPVPEKWPRRAPQQRVCDAYLEVRRAEAELREAMAEYDRRYEPDLPLI